MAGTWSGSTYTGDDSNETVSAGAGPQYIYGKGGEDSLSGGDGDDFIYGEVGDDTLLGGAGKDLLSGGDGKDSLDGGAGDDTLDFAWSPTASWKDTLNGGSGVDLLQWSISTYGQTTAAISKPIVFSLASTPIIQVDTKAIASLVGIERVSLYAGNWLGEINATGGAFNDLFNVGAGADSVKGGGGNDTVSAGYGNDTVKGEAGNDSLYDYTSSYYSSIPAPAADNDSLDGGDGNDWLISYYGRDTLVGGAGDDYMMFHAGAPARADSSVNGGDGNDTLGVIAYYDFFGVDQKLTLTLGSTIKLVSGSTTLFSGSKIENVDLEATYQTAQVKATTGGGNDTIHSGSGADSISTGAGNDDVESAEGADTILSGEGNDYVEATIDKGKVIDLGAGDDTLSIGQGQYLGVDYDLGGSYTGGSGHDTLRLGGVNKALNWNVDTATYDGELVGQFKKFEFFIVSGGSANDTIIGGAGGDNLNGYGGNDSIAGGDGDDTLGGYGNTGSDTIDGGKGNDRVTAIFDAGTVDSLKGGSGDDLLFFYGGFFTPAVVMTGNMQSGATIKLNGVTVAKASQFEIVQITGSDKDDTLIGGEGNDSIEGLSGADKVTTGAGDDVVEADIGKILGSSLDVGTDRIDMGDGSNDFFSGYAKIAVGDMIMSGSLANLTIKGGEEGDKILLTGAGIESIAITTDTDGYSNGEQYRNDSLFGGSKADTLDAGGGANTLKGNGGNDVLALRADNARDDVDGGGGSGDILKLNAFGQSSLKTAWSAGVLSVTRGANEIVHAVNVEVLDIAGSQFTDTLIGAAGNDTLGGTGGGDSLSGGDGNDSLVGGSGAKDTIKGGDGDDTITSGGGGDIIDGGNGADLLRVNSPYGDSAVKLDGANEVAITSNGVLIAKIKNIESLEGSTGADTLTGDGKDNVFGNFGDNSVLDGGAGDDTLRFGITGDQEGIVLTLKGSSSATVTQGAQQGTKVANFENVVGTYGADRIGGDTLANRLDGNAGNDTLSGGLGKDTLTGGAGADEFRFDTKAASSNVDAVVDFVHAEDVITLDDALYTAFGASISSTEFVAKSSGHAATSATSFLIYDKSDSTLWYDKDGNTTGGVSAVQIAQLGTSALHPLDLTYTDFEIV